MKKLVLAALAAGVALIPAAASAQVAVSTGGTHVRTNGGLHHGGLRRGGLHNRSRFHVGGFIGASFFAPQFHIQNWGLYGFAPPPPRHRWVRYYDDAYLIDGRGQVFDTRYDVAWDRYGERWGEGPDGVPYYIGHGDYHPGDRDYTYVEDDVAAGWDYGTYGRDLDYGFSDRYDRDDRDYGYSDRYDHRERDDRYAEHHDGRGYGYADSYGGHGYGQPRYPQPRPYPPAPLPHPCASPCGGYGYGGYGGYGYGYGGYGYMWIPGTVVITETTVTGGASSVVTEEVVEEVVEHRTRRAARPRRARPCCAPAPRPAPRHPPGERG